MLMRLEGCRLHQWETGRHIAYMLDGCADGPVRFQFAMRGMCEAWEVEGDGERCRIPDELLQRPGVLRVWLVVDGEVIHEESYDVEQRPKPSGYVCEPTEYETVAELKEWVRDYLDGVLGVTGVGGVETLPPGSDATASLDDGLLYLGLPRGEPGTRVSVGSVTPVAGSTSEGDLYIDSLTGEIFEYGKVASNG